VRNCSSSIFEIWQRLNNIQRHQLSRFSLRSAHLLELFHVVRRFRQVFVHIVLLANLDRKGSFLGRAVTFLSGW